MTNTYRLVSPKFDRVDLVDKGANLDVNTQDGSHILLFKRAVPVSKENNMPDNDSKELTVEELALQLEEERKNRAAAEARATAAEEALTKSKDKKDESKDEKVEKKEEDKPQTVEEFLKNAPPHVAEFLKAAKTEAEEAKANAAEATSIAKAERDKRILTEFVKSASEDYSHVPGTAEEKGKLLKTLSEKLSPEEFEQTKNLFKAHQTLAKSSNLFREAGRGGGDAVSAFSKIESIATEIRKNDSKLTHEQAIAKALEARPELYDDYLNETE